MRYIIIFFFLNLMLNINYAQEIDNIRVFADPKIESLIEYYKKGNLTIDSREGFRIQIVLSSTREEVNKAKMQFYKEFPDMSCYIVYDQPYYKLRIGDFKTRLEAKKTLLDIDEKYPTAFIVNDEIKIRN